MDISQGKKFSSEIELVLLCSRINIEKHGLDRIKYLINQRIDWFIFKKLIIRNRVYAIVYNNLKPFKKNIPENFIKDLKQKALSTGIRNFFFTVFLQQLIAKFNHCGIFILPFKGPVLAQYIYKDIVLRPFSDLDILVNKSDAVSAFNLLKQQGLIPQQALKKSQFKKYIKDEDHFLFRDPKTKIVIELHWDIAGLYLSRSLTASDLKNHIKTGSINTTIVPTLSPEALLIYLCVHGSKHGWEYLEQICCVTELIKNNPDLNWKEIEKLSIGWKCKKMLFLGLLLSASLLKAQLPESIQHTISNNQTINKMANKIICNLFNTSSNQNIINISDRFSFFHIQIRDSFFDKMHYILRLIFRPTDKEWAYFPVPAPFSFIHYFLRPCRLILHKRRGENA